jgi:Nif-specific regulatory protein
LGGSPLIIGRSSDCDIILSEATVSRRHCQLDIEGDSIRLLYLGTRNKPLVNRLPAESCLLKPGDELVLEKHTFVLAESFASGDAEGLIDHALNTATWDPATLFSLETVATKVSGRLKPRTVQDLAILYDTAAEFAQAGTLSQLVDAVVHRLNLRFSPVAAWVCLQSEGEDYPLYLPHGQAVSLPLPADIVTRAIANKGAVCAPAKDKQKGKLPEAVLAAPILYNGNVLGALALRKPSADGASEEDALVFMLLMAQLLAPMITAVTAHEKLQRDHARLQALVGESTTMLGESPGMRQIRIMIAKAAQSDINVLITGETGTGKEVAARLLHALSNRSSAPMVTINCAAIPPDLFESELFGHERGAFTGAGARKAGLIEGCDGGILFLDEIGDLSLDNQARVLRVIEDKRFRRVGGTSPITVDFRLVCATNKNLEQAVVDGRFREDLYYRIRGIEITLPPLRLRCGDIQVLAEHFFAQCRAQAKRPVHGLGHEVMQYLLNQPWPGNVRELKQSIEAAVALRSGEYISVFDFPHAGRPPEVAAPSAHAEAGAPLTLAELERRHILNVLAQCNGKVLEAARLLGVGKTMLYEKLARYRAES